MAEPLTVAVGLGNAVLDGFFGVVCDSCVTEGFFLPQLSQSMLGLLKLLLQPVTKKQQPATTAAIHMCRVRNVRMTHSRLYS